MEQRQLGDSDIFTSAIGFGTWEMSTTMYGSIDIKEASDAVSAAIDHGITLFDTAEVYGKGLSEELIGDYQQDRSYTFKIATKGGIVIGGKRGENDNSENGLRKALEGSLKRLKMDSVDMYYIHRRDWSISI